MEDKHGREQLAGWEENRKDETKSEYQLFR